MGCLGRVDPEKRTTNLFPVRILLATESFDGIAGTETYVLTLAEQLLRLGHDVRIYSPRLGQMAELARGRGVEVVGELDELGEPADVAVPQDAATAYELVEVWPGVPQVFVCHSAMFDLQQPPLVPGVASAVVVMSDRVHRRVATMDASLRIVRLRQPIDTERLVPRGPAAATPRRVLLLGSYLQGEARRFIVDGWSALGVEIVQVGHRTRPTLHPEDDIAAADIVVGKGRAILEAMSCGRPAYVFDAYGSDGWVTADTYPAIEADSIGGQAFPEVIDAARLRDDLAAYDPAMGHVNRTLVLKHHQARTHAQELVGLLTEVAPQVSPGVTEAAELARLVRMRWRAERELHVLRADFHRIEVQAQQARDQVEQVTRRLEASEARGADAEAALVAERELRAAALRHQARATRRRQALRRRYDDLLRRRWVRLGIALRVLPPVAPDRS